MFQRPLFLVLFFALPCPALAIDHVVFNRNDEEVSVSGKVLVEAQDGGLLVLAPDGALWTVEAADLVIRRQDKAPFEPLTQQDMAARLRAELPAGFEVYTTNHYLVCYNTSRAYAQWVAALYERLYAGFSNYWSKRGIELQKPELPLVVLVFSDSAAYAEHTKGELGDAASAVVAFYSLMSNRVAMYDLTGMEALRRPDDRRGSLAQINQMLARPEAHQMVATIVHEATHQIAFNTGLHARLADVPLWLSEGMAVFFESPDLGSSKGWRTIGSVHHTRLAQFRKYLASRPSDSLLSLIVNDQRMRDTRLAADAYAEAWALNYFLIRQRPKQYAAYLKMLAEKGPLVWDDPEVRLEQFQAAFGDDLRRLDAEFLKSIAKLR